MRINYVTPLVTVAVLSCTASLLVIITFFTFHDLRNKPFMKIITYISIADFLGNVSYLTILRQPEENSPACFLQAYLNSALYPSSWLWTTTLSYLLYSLATEARIPRYFLRFRLICWGLPTLLFMISVPFTHFQDPDNYSFEVCTAAGFAGRVYHDITYYSLFAGSLGYMLYLQIRVRQLEAVGSENVKTPTFVAARTVLTYYPTILMICWFPHVITTLIIVYGTWCNVSCENLYYLGDLLKVLHGTAAASVFFLKSREARRLWYKLLFGKNPDGIITYDLSLINEEHLLADSSLSNGIHETLLTSGPRTADTTYLQF